MAGGVFRHDGRGRDHVTGDGRISAAPGGNSSAAVVPEVAMLPTTPKTPGLTPRLARRPEIAAAPATADAPVTHAPGPPGARRPIERIGDLFASANRMLRQGVDNGMPDRLASTEASTVACPSAAIPYVAQPSAAGNVPPQTVNATAGPAPAE